MGKGKGTLKELETAWEKLWTPGGARLIDYTQIRATGEDMLAALRESEAQNQRWLECARGWWRSVP